MKYLIRIIVTLPALALYGLRGVSMLWKFGGSFRVHTFDPNEALRLLRDLHDLQNGPPLERYREEWEKVMKEIGEFLNQHETE